MKPRKPINSSTLRQTFPNYYQNLFSRCQVVVSLPDDFFWAGEYARFFGGLAIIQKLPTKNLVGLEVLNEEKICFAEELYGFNPSRYAFETYPFDAAKAARVLKFLKEYWPTLDKSKKIKGFRIHILSESHCGGGLGTTGVIFAGLAACLLILSGQVKTDEIAKWEAASINELLYHKQFTDFRDIFRLSWRLSAISRDGNSSGATSFAALIRSPYPILYLSKNINSYLHHPSIASPKSELENCQIINEVPFWGTRMEEIFSLRMPQPWPVDIGRIYSGNLINTENIFKMLFKMRVNLEELQMSINQELNPRIQNQKLNLNALFGWDEHQVQKCSYMDYLAIFNIITVELLLALKDLFVLGPDEENMHRFISSIWRAQDFNHFLGHSSPILDKICGRLSHLVAEENEFNLAGAKIEGIGKGGHVLLMAPSGTMPEKLLSETEAMTKEMGRDIYLDWASWLDGYGEAGLQVEQFIPKKLFSDFISNESYALTSYTRGIPMTRIINAPDLPEIVKEYDFLMFVPHHKIYIQGQILSSKEIHSAKATIEIMKKILAKTNHQLANHNLGDSSYGQSRYDLQSKIFIPLNKALKKHANKELEFKISGGMFDRFTLSINPKNLSIAFVDEIA